MCAFCSKNETEHLFFDCLYAKFVCRLVHFVLGLKPPKDIHDFLQVVQTGGGGFKSILLVERMCNHLLENMAYKSWALLELGIGRWKGDLRLNED